MKQQLNFTAKSYRIHDILIVFVVVACLAAVAWVWHWDHQRQAELDRKLMGITTNNN